MSSNDASILSGVTLENAQGETIQGDDAARGKLLAFYFAGDWCPDCRVLQPSLNKFYKQVNAEKHQLEIVLVGSDRSEKDQHTHLKEKMGPWWAVPFDSKHRDELKRKYGVCLRREQEDIGVAEIKSGIPSLVVVQQNGDLIKLFTDQDLEKNGLKPVEALLKA